MDDGLSSNRVYDIKQDSSGFIWIATNDGLNRFDGTKFKKYQFHNSDGSLSCNGLKKLFIDKNNKMWIGTDRGVDIYDPLTDTFKHFNLKTALGESITDVVSDIIEDKDGEIWFASGRDGLYRYNEKTERLISYRSNHRDNISFSAVISLNEDTRGNIWIGTYSDGLYSYNKKTDSFTSYKKDFTNKTASDNSIQKIFEDSYGNLWIGTFQNGLDKFDYATQTFTNYKDESINNLLYHIHDIIEYQYGLLLITSDNGIGVFNISEKTISPSCDVTSLKLGEVCNKFIYCAYVDEEESIWLGSYYDGIDFYSKYQNGFSFYDCNETTDTKANVINVIRQTASDNKFWIGTDDDGIYMYDALTNDISPVRTAADIGSTYYCIHDILVVEDLVYIATYERGLEIYNKKTKTFKSYLHDDNDEFSIPSSKVYRLHKTEDGKIYIGTAIGLCYFDAVNKKFHKLNLNSRVSSIVEDAYSTLWISTFENGLYSYNAKDNEFTSYKYDAKDNTSIISDFITSLEVDSKNRLWVGSLGYGICQFDYSTGKFIRYENLNIPNNIISTIISDNDNLWLATNKGLVNWNPNGSNLNIYNKSNGLYNEQFSFNAGLKTDDGRILLGSVDGLCAFSPKTLMKGNPKSNLIFTSFSLFGKEITNRDEESPLKNAIGYVDHIELNNEQRSFGFTFSSLSFIAPELSKYVYKLEGFDNVWNSVNNDASHFSYTNIPPGEYTLKLRMSSTDEDQKHNEKSLSIVILPPFYKTNIAFALYFILIVIAAWLIIRYLRLKTEKRQRLRIEKINGEKEKELYDSKIEFFTNIAHEIRTPLSLIIGPLEYLKNTKRISEEYGDDINVIEQNYNRLSTLVNELLDFRKIDAGVFRLNYMRCNINDVAKKIIERFEWTAKQNKIYINFSQTSDKLHIICDEESLTKIISNLLTNGMKHAKSIIDVSIKDLETEVCISVSDDGPGIEDKEKSKIFDLFYQSQSNKKSGIGVGLHMTLSLINLMGGRIEVKDREDGSSGVIFVVYLPKNENKIIDDKSDRKIEELFLIEEQINSQLECEESKNEEYQEEDLGAETKPAILAVDDNPEILNFLSKVLSQDYFVISAPSGEDALKILEANQVDLILSDVMMGGISGFELCRAIKGDLNTSHIPVVLLTAKTDVNSKVEGLDSGADAYIEKPFSPFHLKAQLQNLLRKRDELKQKFAKNPLTEVNTTVYNKLDKEFIDKCTEIIKNNISEQEFSVTTLATTIGMSRTGVFVKIKKITGMTPNDFIKVIRLKMACKMMVESDCRITEIGYYVGFSSSSYFAKCFQKQFGMLPTDFVKNLKEGKITENIDI